MTRRGPIGGGLGDASDAAGDARDAAEDASAGGDTWQGDDEPRLRAMRAVWLAMRDEAASDRGLAELLAAARQKAAAMQPAPPLWQRLLAALRRPAVLAVATAMVLIGGGVLIGRRVGAPPSGSAGLAGERGAGLRGSTTGEPGDRARVAPPGPGHAVSAAPAAGAVSAEPPAAPGGSGSSAPVEPAELRPAPDREAPPGPAVHTARPTPTTVDRPVAPRMEPAGPRPAAAAAPSVSSRPRSKDDGVGAREAEEAAARDLQKKADERVSVLRGSLSPPPRAHRRDGGSDGPTEDARAAVADVADGGTGEGDGTGEGTEHAKAAPPRAQAPRATPAQLYEQCEAAAHRGDCAAVRRIVDEITRIDRGYRDRIARDSAVGRCLAE